MTLDLHFDSWLGDILKKGHKPQMFVFFKNINLTLFDISLPNTVDSRLADTSLLWTPSNADKSQLPGEMHKEMTETNSRYYGLSLLQKCEHFPAPKRDISVVFFSCCSGHLSVLSEMLTHMT